MKKNEKYHHGNLRSALVETAAEMISQEGLEQLTLRALGRRVGVSRTAPYRHFADKTALLCAVAENGFDQLTRSYQKINQDISLGGLTRLKKIGMAYIKFALKNPGPYRLMFGHDITRQYRTPQLLAAEERTFNEFLGAVEAFKEDFTITSDEVILVAITAWSTVHGLSTLLIDGQIHITNDSSGSPTLLTDDIGRNEDDMQKLIDYSMKTLDDFWIMVSDRYRK
ncbi:MAG: WHG domain-containing protein [Proteobacteria bacterium]|nr:WHG domain-containing protein [Pseudomonadota bacterium]MBU1741587.1 WHG domain-containing protein [Pseudomonadota bacterium]